jgi:tetratricopeptide (TPR) repeat protein
LALHPDDKDLLYARALLAERIDRLDVLERDLRAILAADPQERSGAQCARLYPGGSHRPLSGSAGLYRAGAGNCCPNDAAVLDSMGWVQYRLGDQVKALEYLRRAYQANPDAEIAAHLSEVLWVSGQREEAKKIWREAQRKTPDSRQLRQLQERFGW